MEFITVKELTNWVIEQAGLWAMEDMILALRRIVSMHAYLNAQTFFELDTLTGDSLIEGWLESEKIVIYAL